MAGVKQRKGDSSNARVRMLDGKIVKPIMYGKKRKMVGEIEGKLVLNEMGEPVPFKSIGTLEYI